MFDSGLPWNFTGAGRQKGDAAMTFYGIQELPPGTVHCR